MGLFTNTILITFWAYFAFIVFFYFSIAFPNSDILMSMGFIAIGHLLSYFSSSIFVIFGHILAIFVSMAKMARENVFFILVINFHHFCHRLFAIMAKWQKSLAATTYYNFPKFYCPGEMAENSPFLPSIIIITCVTFVQMRGGKAHTG